MCCLCGPHWSEPRTRGRTYFKCTGGGVFGSISAGTLTDPTTTTTTTSTSRCLRSLTPTTPTCSQTSQTNFYSSFPDLSECGALTPKGHRTDGAGLTESLCTHLNLTFLNEKTNFHTFYFLKKEIKLFLYKK